MSATGNRAIGRPLAMSGFTLLEMLVVLAILALIAGLLFPSLDAALRRQDLVDSTKRVELGLRAARAMAIRTGAPVGFAASRDGHGVRYGGVSERLADTATVTLSDPEIVFFADGSARGATIDIADHARRVRIAVRTAVGAIERIS